MSTLAPLILQEIDKKAEVVAVAEVVSIRAISSEEQWATLKVSAVLKGKLGDKPIQLRNVFAGSKGFEEKLVIGIKGIFFLRARSDDDEEGDPWNLCHPLAMAVFRNSPHAILSQNEHEHAVKTIYLLEGKNVSAAEFDALKALLTFDTKMNEAETPTGFRQERKATLSRTGKKFVLTITSSRDESVYSLHSVK